MKRVDRECWIAFMEHAERCSPIRCTMARTRATMVRSSRSPRRSLGSLPPGPDNSSLLGATARRCGRGATETTPRRATLGVPTDLLPNGERLTAVTSAWRQSRARLGLTSVEVAGRLHHQGPAMAYPQHVCPRCRSDEIARVPRNRVVERMAGLLGWRVYICRECRYRFYDRPSQRKAS